MDILSRIFWQVGGFLAVVMFIVAIMALSTAENGQITPEGLAGMGPTFTLAYEVLCWVVYPWLALGAFLLIGFLFNLRRH